MRTDGRLAGAVRPEEAVDLARPDLEVEPVDGADAALELAHELADLDRGCAGIGSAHRCVQRRSAWPSGIGHRRVIEFGAHARRTPVLVVGSINVDIVVHAERLPGPGETVAGGRLERTGGGKGANQAVAAARAGAAVALVGAVGDDDLGAEALDALRAEGVDVARRAAARGRRHGVALIVVDRDGDNQIAVASGANHAVTAEHVRAARRRRGPSCVLASFELLDEPVLAAARLARDAGCPLVVNPAPARRARGRRCASCVPMLTPNRQRGGGADRRARTRRPRRARWRRRRARRSWSRSASRERWSPTRAGSALVAAPAVRAVDTTGAGDMFNGVLAAELARGRASCARPSPPPSPRPRSRSRVAGARG